VGRSASLFVVVGIVLARMSGTAQSASLRMTARPDRVILGEPVTFIITKTKLLPSDLEWSVKGILSESVKFVSAASSQGTCTLRATGTSSTRKAVREPARRNRRRYRRVSAWPPSSRRSASCRSAGRGEEETRARARTRASSLPVIHTVTEPLTFTIGALLTSPLNSYLRALRFAVEGPACFARKAWPARKSGATAICAKP
jgi:hypothetical protein